MSDDLTTSGVECPWCHERIEVINPDPDDTRDDAMGSAWAAHDPQTCFLAWIEVAVKDPGAARWPPDEKNGGEN